MEQQKSGVPGGVYFFISIEARGKAAVFRDAFFKTKVERRWTEIISEYPNANGKEYVVNDRVVHAIVIFSTESEENEATLDEIILRLKQQCLLSQVTELKSKSKKRKSLLNTKAL